MRRFYTPLVPIVAMALWPAPAAARLVDVTWTGTVSASIDQLGLFGPAGGDLTGLRFVAVYRFDTSRGLYEFSNVPGYPAYEQVSGGGTTGFSSPVEFAQLTVNGRTYFNSSDYAGYYGRFADKRLPVSPDESEIVTSVAQACYFNDQTEEFLGADGMQFDVLIGGQAIPTKLDRSFYRQGQTGPNWLGTGWFGKFDLTGIIDTGGSADGCRVIHQTPLSTGFAFDVDSVRVTVPEPASWALMITGFGMVGTALRRRNRRGVAA